MRLPSQHKLLRILLVFIVIVISLELWNGSFLWNPRSRLTAPTFLKPSVILYEEDVTESLQPQNLKIHDRLSFTIFQSPTESTRVELQHDLVLRIADVEEYLNEIPNLHFIDIGVTSGAFSLAVALKGRNVIAVPVDIESAKLLRKGAKVNKVEKRISIIKNPLSGINNSTISQLPAIKMDDLTSTASAMFTNAMLRINFDKLSLSNLLRLEHLIKNIKVNNILINWPKATLVRESISAFFTKLSYQPYTSFIRGSKLSGKMAAWPSFVIWRNIPNLTTDKSSTNVFPIVGQPDQKFQSGVLSKYNGTEIKIFVYDKSDYISKQILAGSSWEYHIIAPLQKYMERYPDLQFIDIGTNIGVYALSVAAMGRKVVAVDANRDNLLRVAQSVRANHFTDRVTLVHNAIDAKRGTMYLKLVKNNIGGSPVVEKGSNASKVEAITADDLLEIIPFKRAVLKVDIEGKEGPMFTKCAKLFNEVDIPLVVFEWATKHKDRPNDAKYLYDFMKSRGYIAYPAIASNTPLPDDYNKWPWDMVWKRGKKAPMSDTTHITKVPDSRIIKYTSSNVTESFNAFNLKTAGGPVTIYGYNAADYITRTIMQTGQWEPEMMTSMSEVLKADKSQGLLDIGTNIGVYALMGAKLGHKVVAVDANIQNVARLRKSLLVNKLQNMVDIIWNAIDHVYTTVQMTIVGSNIGGSFVVSTSDNKGTKGTLVETITLDDLLKVITFKKAIMKYDIEGKEYDGLHNASKLFTTIDIPYVFMEWGVIKRDYKKYGGVKIPKYIIDFFHRHRYTAAAGVHSAPLQPDFNTWPWDIVWRKNYNSASSAVKAPTVESTSTPTTTTTKSKSNR